MITRGRLQFILHKICAEVGEISSEKETRLENELIRALTEEHEGQNDQMLVMELLEKVKKMIKQRVNPDILAAKLQYDLHGVPYIYHKFLHFMIFYAYEYGKAEGSHKTIKLSKIQTVNEKIENLKKDINK